MVAVVKVRMARILLVRVSRLVVHAPGIIMLTVSGIWQHLRLPVAKAHLGGLKTSARLFCLLIGDTGAHGTVVVVGTLVDFGSLRNNLRHSCEFVDNLLEVLNLFRSSITDCDSKLT